MDRHAPGLDATVVTPGRHQPQLDRQQPGGVVRTEARHAAHIEGPGRFDQHQGQLDGPWRDLGDAQTRLCR